VYEERNKERKRCGREISHTITAAEGAEERHAKENDSGDAKAEQEPDNNVAAASGGCRILRSAIEAALMRKDETKPETHASIANHKEEALKA
jgi:hypothetical protein